MSLSHLGGITMGYENCGKHPNSLKALKPISGAEASDRAREMQAKGAETKRQNKAAREAMKLSTSEFKKIKEEVLPHMVKAEDILRVQLAKAISEDRADDVERLATALLPYETPRLSAVEQTLDINNGDLTEEELNAKIAALSTDDGQDDGS